MSKRKVYLTASRYIRAYGTKNDQMAEAPNAEQVRANTRVSVVAELAEKTKNCAVVWSLVSPGRYSATVLPYDFDLTSFRGTVTLDVRKNSVFLKSYRSDTLPGVLDLWDAVDSPNDDNVWKMKNVAAFLAKTKGCAGAGETYSETMSGGACGSGDAEVRRLEVNAVAAALTRMVFDAQSTSAAVSGSLPDVTDDDGDDSYMAVAYDSLVVGQTYQPFLTFMADAPALPDGTYNLIRTRLTCRIDSDDQVTATTAYCSGGDSPSGGTTAAQLSGGYVEIDSGLIEVPPLSPDDTRPVGVAVYLLVQGYGDPPHEFRITRAEVSLAYLSEF